MTPRKFRSQLRVWADLKSKETAIPGSDNSQGYIDQIPGW